MDPSLSSFLVIGFAVLVVIWIAWQIFKPGKSIKGKRVLITGGGLGIGKEMAIAFAKEGCNLVLWDIRSELLDQVAKEIRPLGVQVSCFICDVSNRKMVYEVAERVKKEVGKIDILVNNAGVVSGKPFLELQDEAIERTINVNSLAHFWTLKAFLPDMLKDNSGHIVTIASLMGFVGSAGLTDYCASKFAAVGFHECIRLELRRLNASGVKTLLVAPYAISTGMFSGISPSLQWLIPFLDPPYVARKVVRGVKTDQLVLGMPYILTWVGPITRLILPVSLFDRFISMIGGTTAMNTFQGRGMDWMLKKLDESKKSN